MKSDRSGTIPFGFDLMQVRYPVPIETQKPHHPVFLRCPSGQFRLAMGHPKGTAAPKDIVAKKEKFGKLSMVIAISDVTSPHRIRERWNACSPSSLASRWRSADRESGACSCLPEGNGFFGVIYYEIEGGVADEMY